MAPPPTQHPLQEQTIWNALDGRWSDKNMMTRLRGWVIENISDLCLASVTAPQLRGRVCVAVDETKRDTEDNAATGRWEYVTLFAPRRTSLLDIGEAG